MKRLFLDQLTYFWFIIRTRLLFWLSLICLVTLASAFIFKGNPHFTGYNLVFSGISFDLVRDQHFSFPVLWFVYFIIPLLIILNSFQVLWRNRIIQIRGMGFPPSYFSWINLMLITLFTLGYAFVTVTIATVAVLVTKNPFPNYGSLSGISGFLTLVLLNTLGIILLLLLQEIIAVFNRALGLIMSVSWLIITIYTASKFNPLNYLMISRVNSLNIVAILLYLVITDCLALLIYVGIYRKSLIQLGETII